MAEKTQCLPSGAAPEGQAAFEALRVLLDYLLLNGRMRDGVAAPPLFDRRDFAEFVQEWQQAPEPQRTAAQQQGLQWLAAYAAPFLRADGAE